MYLTATAPAIPAKPGRKPAPAAAHAGHSITKAQAQVQTHGHHQTPERHPASQEMILEPIAEGPPPSFLQSVTTIFKRQPKDEMLTAAPQPMHNDVVRMQAASEPKAVAFAAIAAEPSGPSEPLQGSAGPLITSAAGNGNGNGNSNSSSSGSVRADPSLLAIANGDADTSAMQTFPWPPPRPAAEASLPLGPFTAGRTLGDLDDKLRAVLNQKGYKEFRYLRIPVGGFAIATKIERFEKDGSASPESRRFNMNFSIRSYFRSLFTGETGDYRFFVFLVSDQNFDAPPQRHLGYQGAQAFMETSRDELPTSFRDAKWTRDIRVRVMTYEFLKREGGTPLLREPKLTGIIHLTSSGILASFAH